MVKAKHIRRQGRPGSRQCWTTSVSPQDTAGDMPPGSCIRQDSAPSWETVSWWLTPRSTSTGTALSGMALLEKVRTGSRIQKRYWPPLTPLHRLLQAPEVSDQAKARLLRQLKGADPISLQRDIHILQARLLGKTNQDISLGAVTRRTISL